MQIRLRNWASWFYSKFVELRVTKLGTVAMETVSTVKRLKKSATLAIQDASIHPHFFPSHKKRIH